MDEKGSARFEGYLWIALILLGLNTFANIGAVVIMLGMVS